MGFIMIVAFRNGHNTKLSALIKKKNLYMLLEMWGLSRVAWFFIFGICISSKGKIRIPVVTKFWEFEISIFGGWCASPFFSVCPFPNHLLSSHPQPSHPQAGQSPGGRMSPNPRMLGGSLPTPPPLRPPNTGTDLCQRASRLMET